MALVVVAVDESVLHGALAHHLFDRSGAVWGSGEGVRKEGLG